VSYYKNISPSCAYVFVRFKLGCLAFFDELPHPDADTVSLLLVTSHSDISAMELESSTQIKTHLQEYQERCSDQRRYLSLQRKADWVRSEWGWSGDPRHVE